MPYVNQWEPALKQGFKILPSEILDYGYLTFGNVWWVDGDNGDDTSNGQGGDTAFKTIAHAITAASAGDTIFIKPRKITALSTDPVSYAEAGLVIPNSKPGLRLIGLGGGRTQGGLPQIKPASTTLPLLKVQAPGVLVANLGFNGVNSTGGGVVFFEDNDVTSVAFGGAVLNCHFKNCRGSSASDGTLGGAISLSGAPWQMLIKGNRFFLNLSNIIVIPTFTDAKDIVIEDNVFGGPAASVDFDIYMHGTSGDATGLVIRNNTFAGLPAKNAGSRYLSLTGYTGVLANNQFGTNGGTFDADDGTAGLVPTTVLMAGNWEELTAAQATNAGVVRDSA